MQLKHIDKAMTSESSRSAPNSKILVISQHQVVNKLSSLRKIGEVIILQTPVLHNLKKWPGMVEELNKYAILPSEIYVFKYDGTSLGTFPLGTPEVPSLAVNRLSMHTQLGEYATSLGITIEYGTSAIEFAETHDSGIVLLSDGRKLTADVVVAADGVASKSWRLVVGKLNQPVSSGCAIYRANFPSGPALENPLILKHFENVKTRMELHFGPNAHSIVAKWEDRISWVLTHPVTRGLDPSVYSHSDANAFLG